MNTTETSRRRFVLGTAAAAATGAVPLRAQAPSYATRPVRLVVGNAAGGANDLVARLIGPVLMERLGQPVVVENRPGAAGNIGLEAVVKAPPDGHTLFVSSSVMLASAHTKAAGLDPVDGLEHVSMICDGYFVFSVNTAVPAGTLAEFVALAKRAPGTINYGTPGAGGNIHVAGELFKLRTGIDIVPVHYKSAGALTADLIANQIQMSIQGLAIIGPHIRTGKAKPLMIASRERDRQFPEIPTSVELGIADLDSVTNWFGLHAPRGTPAAIVRTLHALAVEAVGTPAVREKLVAGGFVPVGSSPEEFRARILKDYRIFGDTVREAKVKSE